MGMAMSELSTNDIMPATPKESKPKICMIMMSPTKLTVKAVTVANKMVIREEPAKHKAQPNAMHEIPTIAVSKVDPCFL